MKEQKWSQSFGGFEEGEMEKNMFGCCVWALGSSDGEEAQVGRGVGSVSMLGVAGVRTV